MGVEMNVKSMSMVWLTLGSRKANEHKRTMYNQDAVTCQALLKRWPARIMWKAYLRIIGVLILMKQWAACSSSRALRRSDSCRHAPRQPDSQQNINCESQAASSLCQPLPAHRSMKSSQQVWPSGILCCWPDDLELSVWQSPRHNA